MTCGDVAVKPEDPVWVGHTFLGWYEDVTDQMSPDELEEYKEWLLQALADNKEDNPDSESVRKEFDYLLRAHGGEAVEIAGGAQDVLAGESSLFSTYLLAYKDARKNGSTPEGAQDNDADETSESPDTNGTTGSNGTTGTTRTATPSTSDGTSVSSLAITALAVGTLIAAVITRKKA